MDSATEPSGALSPEAAPRLPNLAVRWLQVFYAPGRLFERLKVRPVWGAALLLGVILSVASFLVIPADLWEQSFREQMMRAGGQVPSGFAFGRVAQILGAAGLALFWLVWAFLLAGMFTLVFPFLLGDDGRYVQYLAVVTHGLLIAATGALLVTPLKMLQQDIQMTLNLGLFFPVAEGSYLFRLLRMLDLFMLWGYVVMALGVSRIDARRKWGTAAVLVMIVAVGLTMLIAIFSPPNA